MDENSVEQANFMSKFGMSGTGIQVFKINSRLLFFLFLSLAMLMINKATIMIE